MAQDASVYDRFKYNNLPSIEFADAAMREGDKLNLAFSAFRPIFLRHNMCDKWGISILHRHWRLEEDEIPIQEVIASDSPKEFETYPRTNTAATDFWPSLLAVNEDGCQSLQTLEFSSDPFTKEAYRLLKDSEDFVQDFCVAAKAHNLSNTFGLIATKSVTPGFGLVEFNFDDRSSVLKETASPELAGKRLFETSWRFAPEQTNASCEGSCFARCIANPDGSHPSDHPHAHTPG